MKQASKTSLNPRQEKFAHKYTIEGLPAGVAYSEAYNRPIDGTSYANASRLIRNANIQTTIEDLSEQYKRDSFEAYEVQKELMHSKTTPANVRASIAKEIQDRAGYGPTKRVEARIDQNFPGITDLTRDDLRAMLARE